MLATERTEKALLVKKLGSTVAVTPRDLADDLKDVMERALLPDSLFSDDFDTLIAERATMLAARARQLTGAPEKI